MIDLSKGWISAVFIVISVIAMRNLAAETANLPFISMPNPQPRAGELFQVFIITDSSVKKVYAKLQAINQVQTLDFQAEFLALGNFSLWIVRCATPAEQLAQKWQLTVLLQNQDRLETHNLAFRNSEHAFHTETIEFDTAMSQLKTVPDPQKDRESQILSNVLFSFDSTFLLNGHYFIEPVQSIRKTAFFGDRRIYAYQDGKTEKTQHNGIDYGGDAMAVAACASGSVMMASKRIVTGNTVVIQHGPGLFSLYYHLSKISVSAGDRVRAGQTIGLSGATGLVTGPHLHWEMRNQGRAVDPESLILNGYIDTQDLPSLLLLPLRP